MTKIEALQKTIYNLENNVYTYEWGEPHSCNCGVLCQSIAGRQMKPKEFYFTVFSVGAQCMKTGIGVDEIFSTLLKTGFTYEDITGLEFLSNRNIAQRAGIQIDDHPQKFRWCTKTAGYGYREKETLLTYLKAWVSILQEQSQNTVSKEQNVPECDTTKPIVVQELGQYKNISKQIAVLPVDEKSDVKIINLPEKIK